MIYTRPTENLLRMPGVVMSVNVGTADAEYPAAYLIDEQPERPAKLIETSGAWVADIGVANAPEIAAVIHHNFTAGSNVRLQGHSSNAWGAPAVDLPFTVPARYPDLFTANLWLDLKTLIPVAATRTLRYWRLVQLSVNTAPLAAGEWVLYSAKRDFGVRDIQWGSDRSWKRPVIKHDTELMNRRKFDLGTTLRTMSFTVQPDATYLAELDAWFRSAQGAYRPFLVVPANTDVDPWFVEFEDDDVSYARQHPNFYPARVKLREVGRGLYP